MKNLLIGLIAVAFGGALSVANLQGAAAKSKQSKPPAKGEHFDMSGTVKKNEIDFCMVTGLHYSLHPKKGDEVKLKPTSKHDSQILDDAAKNNSSVHVAGTWQQTVECHYVQISKVEKIK
jgi:hypothetical protein